MECNFFLNQKCGFIPRNNFSNHYSRIPKKKKKSFSLQKTSLLFTNLFQELAQMANAPPQHPAQTGRFAIARCLALAGAECARQVIFIYFF